MSGIFLVDLIVFGLTGLGIFFSLLRFLMGPSSFERLMSVDMMNIMFVGLISLLAYVFKNTMYMDIAILYGLLAFVETIVFARYLEHHAEQPAVSSESKVGEGDVK